MAIRHKIKFSGQKFLEHGGIKIPCEIGEHEKEFYIKVDSVKATKLNATAIVSFSSDGLSFLNLHEFKLSESGDNPTKQAYIHLKTLPQFAGAEDC